MCPATFISVACNISSKPLEKFKPVLYLEKEKKAREKNLTSIETPFQTHEQVQMLPPCFLLSSHRFDFPIRCFSIRYILSTTIISISSLSLQLVLLAPINSCSLYIILY